MSSPIKKEQLQIRVSAEEKAALRALAERAGTDLSTFVLTRALPRLEREFHMLLHAIAEPARRAIALRELNDLLTDITAGDLGAVCADPWGLERLDERMQNYVAAMVEEAAGHLGVMPPRWTAEVAPLRMPWFNTESKVLRPYLLMASPVPYRRRNIFVESVLGTRAGSGERARARVPGFRGGEGTVRYASEGVVWRTAPRLIREGGRAWGDVDPEKLSRERIESLLRALSDELGARGTTGEVHVVGGAVMCLVYGAREATKDVDALMRPSTALHEAAAAVGARAGVAEDWLNDAVRGFLSVRGAFDPWLELPNLRVMVAQPRYLLAMKCLAFRPEGEAPDRADVRFLVRLLDVRSAAEALAIVSEYYDEPMLTLRTRLSLEEFFGMKG
jgi:uncharacterized protein (DUF1778 family)